VPQKDTLRGTEEAEITRPNQVWAMDITYIPMERGFARWSHRVRPQGGEVNRRPIGTLRRCMRLM
jgi:hypothetical protein